MNFDLFLFEHLHGLFFYMVATALVISALAAVLSKNTVHAVMFLILCFFEAAGLFLLLGAEFLAFLLIIVYVGAVAVLFLFVVMMIDLSRQQIWQTSKQFMPLVGMVALLFVGSYMALIYKQEAVLSTTAGHMGMSVADQDNESSVSKAGQHTEKADFSQPLFVGAVQPVKAVADGNNTLGEQNTLGEHKSQDKEIAGLIARDPLFLLPSDNNTKKIGDVLYTEFGPLFHLCGFILLVAMIGAITLTLRKRPDVKRQNIRDQVMRSRDTVSLQNVSSGKGLLGLADEGAGVSAGADVDEKGE
jgi:NADH-quinone oxidoreductase subunit J